MVNIQYHLPEDNIMVLHLNSQIQITSGFMTLLDEPRNGYNRYMHNIFMNTGITFIFVLNDVSSVKTWKRIHPHIQCFIYFIFTEY